MPILNIGKMPLSYPIRTNDRETFTLIYNEYFERMYSFARTFVSTDYIEDILHEIFIGVWKSGAEFPNEKALLVYLQLSVKHKCFNSLKAVRTYEEVQDIEEEEVYVIEASLIKRLNEAVDNLTTQQKLIIQLRFFNGLTVPQIVSKTGLSYNTIRAVRYNAMKALRKIIPPPH